MEYISAIGFAEVAKYEPSDLVEHRGRRVFVHPNYTTKITFDDELDVWFHEGSDDDVTDVNMRLAYVILGENTHYFAPFIEFNINVMVYLPAKFIHIEMHEAGCDPISVRIFYGNNIEYHELVGRLYQHVPATPANIIACLRERHTRFFEHYDARKLRERCEELAKENAFLKEQLKFRPDGPGFIEAKNRFEFAVEEQTAKKRRVDALAEDIAECENAKSHSEDMTKKQ